MPVCKKCGVRFPCRITVEGRQRNFGKRKYCLQCSPFNKHNTKSLEKAISTISSGDRLRCTKCGRDYTYKVHMSTKTVCNSCLINGRRFQVKKRLVEVMGGKCNRCGYSRNIKALSFHHRNHEEKEFSISGKHCFSLERLLKEVEKCDLVCMNCHAEIHDELNYETRSERINRQ